MLKVAEKLTTKVSNPSRLSYFPNRCTVVPSSNLAGRGCRGDPKPLGRDPGLHPLILSQRVRDPGPSRDEGLDKILQLLEAGASPCLGSSTLEAPVHHQSTSS